MGETPRSKVRHDNKCLQFYTADGVDASEILEQYEDEAQDTSPGPMLSKWRAFRDNPKEDELLVEGFPWTLFRWSNGYLIVEDDSGSIKIDADLIDEPSGMHGLS